MRKYQERNLLKVLVSHVDLYCTSPTPMGGQHLQLEMNIIADIRGILSEVTFHKLLLFLVHFYWLNFEPSSFTLK